MAESQRFLIGSLARRTLTVGGLTALSRISGFGRDIILATLLGTSGAADAFLIALRLPNFFRRVFAEGSVRAAFIPLFTSILSTKGANAAFLFAADCLLLSVLILTPVIAAMIVAMPWVISFITPGFEPEIRGLTVDLAQITFSYLGFISIAAFLGGILDCFNRFAFFAAIPIVFNVVLMIVAGLAAFSGQSAVYFLAYGVGLAGLFQVAIVWKGAWDVGLRLSFSPPRMTAEVKRLLVLMGPTVVSGVVMQIGGVIDIFLASLVSTGAVSYLYYAERVYQLPVGLIGVALGTSLLPSLSRARERPQEAAYILNRGLEWGMILGIPSAATLVILAEPIVGLLYQRGNFDQTSTDATAFALQAYALGIPAYIAVKILTTFYFSRQNMVTPMKLTLILIALQVPLAFWLIHPFKHGGIALATAITYWIAGLGLLIGRREVFDARLWRCLRGTLLATGVMTAGMIALAPMIRVLDLGAVLEGLAWIALMMGAGGVYFASVRWLDILNLK